MKTRRNICISYVIEAGDVAQCLWGARERAGQNGPYRRAQRPNDEHPQYAFFAGAIVLWNIKPNYICKYSLTQNFEQLQPNFIHSMCTYDVTAGSLLIMSFAETSFEFSVHWILIITTLWCSILHMEWAPLYHSSHLRDELLYFES